jgi:hypothetical protein
MPIGTIIRRHYLPPSSAMVSISGGAAAEDSACRAQMWMFELFDLAWGMRDTNKHGVDPETRRMIRLATA